MSLLIGLALVGCGSEEPTVTESRTESQTEGQTERTTDESADAYAASTDAWHAERIATLTAPDGWLALVTLAWLDQGENRIGRAADDAVSYAGLPADLVGSLTVAGRTVSFAAAPGVDVEGVTEDGAIRTDADGDPTMLAAGDCRFHVIERGGMLAVRMKDPNAETRTAFGGIPRFAVDPAWRIEAAFVAAAADATVPVDSVIGVVDETAVAGRARFEHDGVAVDMVLHPGGSEDRFFVVFADATSGTETYPPGRFVAAELVAPDRVVLDFNRAYNPPCAFTAFATCPLPVDDNRLPFRVTAGERMPATVAD